ncbi:MAG TPA: T9SS type A sorting domain-containing protein [Bacteroidia bacterium]|nr:T9SS type A sorting domain-containing protein [Bacteroidia bacterium]
MKKIIISCLFYLFVINGKTQSLQNTTWLGTNPPSINLFFQYGTDTIFYSTTGSGFQPLSLYTTLSNQIYIFDIPGASFCTDTAVYTFTISGNNLYFLLISDLCAARRNTLLNYSWTKISTTDIHTLTDQSNSLRFQNPALNGISYFYSDEKVNENTLIKIYDFKGLLLLEKPFEDFQNVLSLEKFPTGIYLVVLENKTGIETYKIIRD